MARLPSAIAALGLVLGISVLAAYHFGKATGLLAGAIQATTAWTVLRGRLAEADILLACLLTWSIVAFDRLRNTTPIAENASGSVPSNRALPFWRWLFFGLLGLTSFVKGTGFGAALVLSVVAIVIIWDRDRALRARLHFPAGWLLTGFLTARLAGSHGSPAWPQGGRSVGLARHLPDEHQSSHGVFARESWPEYILNVLGQGLPWTPLVLISLTGSLWRAFRSGMQPASARPEAERTRALAGRRLMWA